nr:hypothetical protein [Sodalinema gerasimenkoae]
MKFLVQLKSAFFSPERAGVVHLGMVGEVVLGDGSITLIPLGFFNRELTRHL